MEEVPNSEGAPLETELKPDEALLEDDEALDVVELGAKPNREDPPVLDPGSASLVPIPVPKLNPNPVLLPVGAERPANEKLLVFEPDEFPNKPPAPTPVLDAPPKREVELEEMLFTTVGVVAPRDPNSPPVEAVPAAEKPTPVPEEFGLGFCEPKIPNPPLEEVRLELPPKRDEEDEMLLPPVAGIVLVVPLPNGEAPALLLPIGFC